MNTRTIRNESFRMRGEEMTRIEAFVAAAFAFAVTMLVISLGTIPSTFDEFLEAVKLIPSFAASGAIIFWIWYNHATWCRRYGLEDGPTVVLSGVLIFLVLIYIYPLRLMMQGMFSTFTGGYLPMLMDISSVAELRFMFAFYAIGFLLLCLNFIALLLHAKGCRQALELNDLELFDTQTDIILWSATASVCCLSLITSLVMSGSWVALSGFSYFLLFPVLTWVGFYRGNKRKVLAVR